MLSAKSIAPRFRVVIAARLEHDAAMNKSVSHGEATAIHSRFDLAGTLILVVGIVVAALIYMTAADDSSTAVNQELVNAKRYQYEVERFGGKAAVLMVELNHWFDSLWQGKRLAATIAGLSIAAALGCFWIAHLIADDLPGSDHGDQID